MFTLKLYRRDPSSRVEGLGRKVTKTLQVGHVVVMEIGKNGHALELQAFLSNNPGDYETYYIGDPEPGMEAYGRDDLHLNLAPNSWWGWGLLENQHGRTSAHFRPGSYG